MKIISFAWTTPALKAGAKTVTRRDWDDDYARRFRPGELVQAFDRSPRHKGKPIAILRIVSVTKEPDADTPDADYEAEGFGWFFEREFDRAQRDDPGSVPVSAIADRTSWEGFCDWRELSGNHESWVVRFEIVEFVRKVAA